MLPIVSPENDTAIREEYARKHVENLDAEIARLREKRQEAYLRYMTFKNFRLDKEA